MSKSDGKTSLHLFNGGLGGEYFIQHPVEVRGQLVQGGSFSNI